MWIYLSDSFLSIVEFHDNRDILLVRARHKGDIERVFPNTEVKCTPNHDYLYRALVARDVVAEAIAEQVKRVDYGNFKNSVKGESRRERESRHKAYTRCWEAMVEWQRLMDREARG
jgi:hypothetical protein